MTGIQIPHVPPRNIVDVRDWVSAWNVSRPVQVATPSAKAKDWTLTRLRLCNAEQAAGGLIILVNGYTKLVVPLVAIANGEWFTLSSALMLSDTDVVTMQTDMPTTVALAGLYLLRNEAKS